MQIHFQQLLQQMYWQQPATPQATPQAMPGPMPGAMQGAMFPPSPPRAMPVELQHQTMCSSPWHEVAHFEPPSKLCPSVCFQAGHCRCGGDSRQ
jgi:hypothetical protein